MEPRNLVFEDIQLGDSVSFEKTWSERDMEAYIALSGDAGLIHSDDAYARTTQFGKKIVHGMLVGSSCSAFVGMYLPGGRNHCLKMVLVFKKPVYSGDHLTVTGTIVAKSVATRMLDVDIKITRDDDVVLTCLATVQMRMH
jgi:acyl dehydratase